MVDISLPTELSRDDLETLLENGLTVEASDFVFNNIMGKYKVATMRDTKEIYLYNGSGVYDPNGECVIHQDVTSMYGKHFNIHTYKQIESRIEGSSYTDREEFNKGTTLLPVENGILNILTGELLPFSPEYKFTFKIPVKYDPTAVCQEIDKFICNVFQPVDVDLAYEVIAYCLYRKIPIQKAIMLLGEGSNGKSEFLNLICTFLGSKNVCNVPLQDLVYNRFAIGSLYGKMANIYPDLEESALQTTGKIKAAISGDMMPYEKKHHDIGNFEPFAKHLFSANKLPKTKDTTFAYFRRWVMIECLNRFSQEKGNIDPKLREKILAPEELSGLLNKSIEIIKKLMEKGDFSEGSTKSIEMKWFLESDSIRAFCTYFLIRDQNGMPIKKEDLYQVYVQYCAAYDIEPETPQMFGREFKLLIPYAQHVMHEKSKSVKGIGFKDIDQYQKDTKYTITNITDLTNIVTHICARARELVVENNGNIGIQPKIDSYNNKEDKNKDKPERLEESHKGNCASCGYETWLEYSVGGYHYCAECAEGG